MAIKPVLRMGDPRLLRIAQPVREFDTPALRALIEDLFDTMYAAKGVGLAANQVGVPLQVARQRGQLRSLEGLRPHLPLRVLAVDGGAAALHDRIRMTVLGDDRRDVALRHRLMRLEVDLRGHQKSSCFHVVLHADRARLA